MNKEEFIISLMTFSMLSFVIYDSLKDEKPKNTYTYQEAHSLFKEYQNYSHGVNAKIKKTFLTQNDLSEVWESYEGAKKVLLNDVYRDYKKTLYCKIDFSNPKQLIYPKDYDLTKLSARAERIEIEHVVPAETFGSLLPQWHLGGKACYSEESGPYRGRKCAEETSQIFRIMLSDMYNLYPSLGSLNGLRASKDFKTAPSNIKSEFKSCTFKITPTTVEVDKDVMGLVARTYLYFEYQYRPVFNLTDEQRYRFLTLSNQNPVTKWECLRSYRIEQIQKRENPFVKAQCLSLDLWKDNSSDKHQTISD